MDVLDLMQTTAEWNWFQFGHIFFVVDVIAVVFTILEKYGDNTFYRMIWNKLHILENRPIDPIIT